MFIANNDLNKIVVEEVFWSSELLIVTSENGRILCCVNET